MPVLEVIAQDLDLDPPFTGLCAGYEQGNWRSQQLAGWMFDELPAFALNWSSRQQMKDDTARRLMLRAARAVYASDKYKSRGEFGELLLHCVLRQLFGTEPAVSKLYYKDSANDTVKGFDAVHVVATNASLELWLGEVKFYSKISSAIADVVKELETHTNIDFMRGEFLVVSGKIDHNWPHAERLMQLLDPNTRIEDVFDAVTIPVLLTYDSGTVASHQDRTEEYTAAFREEVARHHKNFSGRSLPKRVKIHLLLVPLKSKQELVKLLHDKLTAWQNL